MTDFLLLNFCLYTFVSICRCCTLSILQPARHIKQYELGKSGKMASVLCFLLPLVQLCSLLWAYRFTAADAAAQRMNAKALCHCSTSSSTRVSYQKSFPVSRGVCVAEGCYALINFYATLVLFLLQNKTKYLSQACLWLEKTKNKSPPKTHITAFSKISLNCLEWLTDVCYTSRDLKIYFKTKLEKRILTPLQPQLQMYLWLSALGWDSSKATGEFMLKQLQGD